jgi:lysozyme family protein
MMADFEKALAYTLKHEGGWADDPADPGGATNFGITLKTARKHGVKSKEDLRAIPMEVVRLIYYDGYWHFDAVGDQRVATKLFDMAVNMGPCKAIGLLQLALCDMGCVVDVDGDFGPRTLAAVNSALNQAGLLDALCGASEAHYHAVAEARPASQKFLKGWLKRAAGVPSTEDRLGGASQDRPGGASQDRLEGASHA